MFNILEPEDYYEYFYRLKSAIALERPIIECLGIKNQFKFLISDEYLKSKAKKQQLWDEL